ncbi:CD109 antigen [Lutzomyia longipalpis]|uniref:CD109 antigen n=1 Tax=Lutzomyia longipalpis TaxID=7200 RepID=UPI0024836857|nr:CD109 antigen [Lutzomyia longipalpis]
MKRRGEGARAVSLLLLMVMIDRTMGQQPNSPNDVYTRFGADDQQNRYPTQNYDGLGPTNRDVNDLNPFSVTRDSSYFGGTTDRTPFGGGGGFGGDNFGGGGNVFGTTDNFGQQRDPFGPPRDPFGPQRDPLDPNRPFDPNAPRPYDPTRPFGTERANTGFGNRDFGRNPSSSVPGSPFTAGARDRDFNPSLNPFNRNLYTSDDNLIINEATYFIVASRMVRPGQVYRVAVNVVSTPLPITVRASISRNGVEMSADSKDVKEGIPEELLMRVPTTSVIGEYKLRVEGLYNAVVGGIAFLNETKVTFSQRSMTIFVQTDKPVYMQSETVRFRTIPITTELRGFDNSVDVYMVDPQGNIMRRWLSRQSNLGTVSLNYKLSDQPRYGEWKIRVVARGQVEEHSFQVEEYYQSRFEVNVTMPAFFFNTDPYIYGKIMANFTSGAPVRGNLTLKATIRPIGFINPKILNQRYRVGNSGGYRREDEYYNRDASYYNLFGPQNIPPDRQFLEDRYREQQGFQESYIVEKHFNFDERWPFWMDKPEYNQVFDPWTRSYRNQLPYLRFFNGTFDFKYPMAELEQLVPNLSGMEVLITATVGERFYDEVIEGYAMTRIYNSSIRVAFLGGSPQVFKPAMPFTCYLVAEYHDGSPLPFDNFFYGTMEITGWIESRSGGRRDYPLRNIRMSERDGIWELKVDLRNDLNLDNSKQSNDFLNDATSMRLIANFIDSRGERASSELLLLGHHSPLNQQVKITTSTTDAKVGEYIVLHVQSNFHMDNFHYIVMSKGIVLLTGQENMQEGIRTMAITLSAEMAPVSTVVVWHVGRRGLIVADSLTFPVNGISRNNFTVYINNRKARTGDKVEVAIYGEPGAYVGLSGIDNAFYTMQAGNELTYANVITKMATFDEQTNGTFKHRWYSHEGNPDELVYYPSSTFGIDANRTFEFAGLVVFSDAVLPRRQEICNASLGYGECLNGRCYRLDKECDGYLDCEDGTDEINCDYHNATLLADFRKYRFNRIQRHYENVWLWRDVNIGPHGRYIFNIDVPHRPALWMVSAFGVSPTMGFGMIAKAIEYVGVQPFFINVEMPTECRQGEQVGIRVTVFNYMTNAIEATVVLHGSPDYKFVHVEENGIVRSYNPRTSFGEHQFFIYLEAQSTSIVYLPIVPQRLGDIDVTVHAATLLGLDKVTRRLHVEADGLPQYRHQSILLDLSNRAYVFQYMHVNVTETPIIPYQVDRYYVYGSNKARISLVGDVVGPIFPTMPVNVTSLIHLPMESAEQNMFSFAANLFTVYYMRLINQRNKTMEKHAFHHLNIGYQRQLSFMNKDGSFSLFRSDWNQSDPSVWLTAYCVRIFQEASFYEWENYIYIDPNMIQKSVAWLLRHQMPEGSFYETTWSPDRKMNGTENELLRARNITLTAHVLITLASVKDLAAGGLGARVAMAQQRAIDWIDRNLKLIKDFGGPYEVAIVTYALMQSNAPHAEQAFSILAKHARTIGEFMYWGNEEVPQPPTKLENQKYFSLPRLPYKYDSLNIETTAYALLVYVARRELFVDPIVRWLNAQRLTDGGWASTQDTSTAMKALIEYTIRTRIRDVSQLAVTVEATSLPGKSQSLYITNKNLAELQSLEIPNAWGTVKVQAKGAGYAILQMHVQYNVDDKQYQTAPPVFAFDLNAHAVFHGRNQSHITYYSCQRWINVNESVRSGMAVLDVAIPTGYFVQQQKLDSYILSRRVRNLQRAKYFEKKVLFYFDYLDSEDVCLNFTIERWFPVANMSRYLPIRVYDYYAPERFNETLFDALPTYLLNICEVCGSSQCPYCAIYNAAIKAPIPFFLILGAVVAITVRHFRITGRGFLTLVSLAVGNT